MELFVAGEAAIRGQRQEVRLNAFEVMVPFERLAEGGEGLVHRVGGYCADGAAEYVCLDEPHRGRKVVGAERAVRVVMIKLEQEWVGDIHFKLAQVVQGETERGVLFATKRQRAEVAGEGTDIPDQYLDAGVPHRRGTGIVFERLVDLALARDVARAHCEVVTHKA